MVLDVFIAKTSGLSFLDLASNKLFFYPPNLSSLPPTPGLYQDISHLSSSLNLVLTRAIFLPHPLTHPIAPLHGPLLSLPA